MGLHDAVRQGGKMQLFWEDFTPGQSRTFGDYLMTEDEIIDFATRYDPLPMHLGPETAKDSPLGVFCASGIHTFATTQRMLADNLYRHCRLIAGGLLQDFRLERPVLPGDRISVKHTALSAKAHTRRGDAGWLDFRVETHRADGVRVMQYETRILFERRTPVAVEPA